MKNLKKISALILALILMMSVTACNKKVEEDTTMDLTKEAVTEVEETTVEEATVEQLAAEYFANMPEHAYKIGQVEFVDKVKAGDDMVVLDIRSAEDYGKGHIKGAVNVPWGPAISEDLSKITQDKEVFIYCYTGQTAGQAVMTLNIAGINARSVSFGWNMGISKVEGFDALTETTATEFGSETYDVPANVQASLTAYYAGLADVKETTFANYKVSEDNLKAMMDAGEDFYLLSIRKPEDFAAAHIEGAENVPFNNALVDNLGSVPKDKKVVVYCYTGQTAGQTVAAMRLLGYDAVSLNGGIGMPANAPMGWTNKGFAVISASSVYNGVMNYFAQLPDTIYKIAQVEFVDKVKAGDDMVVLDIRAAADYEKGHVKGAINIPWGPAISENLSKIPQDKEVFIYCYTGQTAGQAVMTLNLAGINARSVNFGWNQGISKVEGVDAVTETTANAIGTNAYDVDAEIQTALTAYYAGLAEVKDTTYANYKISEDNLAAMIDTNEDFFLLSSRSADDFAKGHIKGAVNVPFNNEMMNNLAGVPKDKKVVIYCYSGQTAGQATAAMRLLGYDAVSLNGGAGVPASVPNGWVNHGYELTVE